MSNPSITMTTAALDVMFERDKQIQRGRDTKHDIEMYDSGVLACAAAAFALDGACDLNPMANPLEEPPDFFPWEPEFWDPTKEPRQKLVKAAALLLAEIEALDAKS